VDLLPGPQYSQWKMGAKKIERNHGTGFGGEGGKGTRKKKKLCNGPWGYGTVVLVPKKLEKNPGG